MLPQISFRFMVGLTAMAAVILTVGRLAGGGAMAARALLLGLAFPVVVVLIGSLLFLLSWAVASLTLSSSDLPSRPSPFADDQLPPQTLPPRDRAS